MYIHIKYKKNKNTNKQKTKWHRITLLYHFITVKLLGFSCTFWQMFQFTSLSHLSYLLLPSVFS